MDYCKNCGYFGFFEQLFEKTYILICPGCGHALRTKQQPHEIGSMPKSEEISVCCPCNPDGHEEEWWRSQL